MDHYNLGMYNVNKKYYPKQVENSLSSLLFLILGLRQKQVKNC